jgi:hypothetical protein
MVELLHGEVGGAELEKLERSGPKQALSPSSKVEPGLKGCTKASHSANART